MHMMTTEQAIRLEAARIVGGLTDVTAFDAEKFARDLNVVAEAIQHGEQKPVETLSQ